MPGAVSEKTKPVKLQDKKMENIRSIPLFYKCESKKWESVYRLALTGRTPPGYVGRRSDEEFLPEKRRDPGERWERVFEVITKNQEIK